MALQWRENFPALNSTRKSNPPTKPIISPAPPKIPPRRVQDLKTAVSPCPNVAAQNSTKLEPSSNLYCHLSNLPCPSVVIRYQRRISCKILTRIHQKCLVHPEAVKMLSLAARFLVKKIIIFSSSNSNSSSNRQVTIYWFPMGLKIYCHQLSRKLLGNHQLR